MDWNQFDKIYFIGENKYYKPKILKIIAKNNYKINTSNIQYLINSNNKIINDIYNVLKKNKIIIDWWNTQYPGDFYGNTDLNYTLKMINIIQESYLLGYNKIYISDFHDFPNFHSNKKLSIYLENIPNEFNGIILLDYKGQIKKIGNKINDYYSYIESTNDDIKKISNFIISKKGMKNILDNQTMILKNFEYYLTNRNMSMDKTIQYITLNRI